MSDWSSLATEDRWSTSAENQGVQDVRRVSAKTSALGMFGLT
jgi:hypothetical protein